MERQTFGQFPSVNLKESTDKLLEIVVKLIRCPERRATFKKCFYMPAITN